MKKSTLTYKKILDIVEKFMIDSKIRQYCTEVCKGQCCLGCYADNPKSCRHCEGRRLTCSIYTCRSLRRQLSEKTETILYRAGYTIRDQYYKYNRGDIYFEPADEAFAEKARFTISIKRNLERISIEEIKKTMTNLIVMGVVVYNP